MTNAISAPHIWTAPSNAQYKCCISAPHIWTAPHCVCSVDSSIKPAKSDSLLFCAVIGHLNDLLVLNIIDNQIYMFIDC